LTALSTNFPLYEYVSSTRGASLASAHQAATQNANIGAQKYQEKIIDYAIEWEQAVTERVDDGLKKTNVLYQKLNHYQNKIDSLRKKVNAVENKGKESPAKLNQKLARNEAKVKQAWELHEASASTLCNLLEEVTKGGWKDLHPLVMATLQWEVDRVTGEQDAYGMLSKVMKDMTSPFYEQASVPVVEQAAKDPSSGSSSATATEDSDSDTTGPPDVVSVSSSDDGDDTFKTAESPEWN
jgi:small-conductance mechanosensitive channel